MDEDQSEFYVLYCCNKCHAQFGDKDSLAAHWKSCGTHSSPLLNQVTNQPPIQQADTVDGSPSGEFTQKAGTSQAEAVLESIEVVPSNVQGYPGIEDHQYMKPGISLQQDTHILDRNHASEDVENMERIQTNTTSCAENTVAEQSSQTETANSDIENVSAPSDMLEGNIGRPKRKRGRPPKKGDGLEKKVKLESEQTTRKKSESEQTTRKKSESEQTTRKKSENEQTTRKKSESKKAKKTVPCTSSSSPAVRTSARLSSRPRLSFAKLVKFNYDISDDSDSKEGEEDKADCSDSEEEKEEEEESLKTDNLTSIDEKEVTDNSSQEEDEMSDTGKISCSVKQSSSSKMKEEMLEKEAVPVDRPTDRVECFTQTPIKGVKQVIKKEKFLNKPKVPKKKQVKHSKIEKEVVTKEPVEKVVVKLEEHTDKFTTENFESIAPMDRGKSKEEKTYQRYSCSLCESYKTPSVQAMENHLSLHLSNKLTCSSCGFVASTLNLLYIHRKERHRDIKNMIICESCGKVFRAVKFFREHLGSVHGIAAFACKKCRQKFKSQKDLKEHRLKEHESAAFRCERCSTIFISKLYYKRHVESKACEKASIQCEHCGCFKKARHLLQEHIKRVHTREHIFKCKFCPYSSSQSYLIRDHMHTHTGVHPHKCKECTFTCVKPWQLVSHMRTHTGEKQYKCDQCSYAAAWNVQLKTHKKAHLSATQVLCKTCNIVFKDVRCFILHQNKAHPGSNPSTASNNPFKSRESRLRNLLQVREVEGTNVVLYEEEPEPSSAKEQQGPDPSGYTLNQFKLERRASSTSETNYIASWVQVGTDLAGQPTQDLQTCVVRVIDDPEECPSTQS